MIKRLSSLSTQIKLKVNDSFRPRGQCVACLASIAGHGLCIGCFDDLPVNLSQCRQCALPLAIEIRHPVFCGECLSQPPPFERVIAPWRYQFPVNQLVSRYKYSGQRALGQPLITSLVTHVREQLAQEPDRRPDVLIPSPMHSSRQRKRGFNQAEDIAEQLSRAIDVPWSVSLARRLRKAPAQSGLKREQRLANLRNSFAIYGPAPGRIAIVDDVMTTGATARALSLALQGAGAKHIEVWALARTPG
ncbi:ComF family protein [Marinobacter sp.]|uniref:ComF family protein n=1 Tax=Marinobacter sp. TaxID=50741 RepID=UPI00384CA51B